jgi:hypothetical protein
LDTRHPDDNDIYTQRRRTTVYSMFSFLILTRLDTAWVLE